LGEGGEVLEVGFRFVCGLYFGVGKRREGEGRGRTSYGIYIGERPVVVFVLVVFVVFLVGGKLAVGLYILSS